jgi:copper/silver efflux system protein
VVPSSSAFGFSMINVIFEDAVDLYFARSRVLERLNLLGKTCRPGVVPTLGSTPGGFFWLSVGVCLSAQRQRGKACQIVSKRT